MKHWLGLLAVAFVTVASAHAVPSRPMASARPAAQHAVDFTRRPTSSSLTAVWANDGEDKVTQDELRASGGASVTNSAWDGKKIILFGAKNEVVAFDLIMEAATNPASNVSVTLSDLTGPNDSVIRYATRPASNLFNWTTTESELFYVRYLQILGLSNQDYGLLNTAGQEPTFPQRAQCPPPLQPGCAWTDRPVSNKFYPDIAVPIELNPQFNIAASNNQSVWADIYIPETAAAGQYAGNISVSENGVVTHSVPIKLTVRNFTLPDTPNSKTMMFTSYGDLRSRYGDPATLGAMQNQMLVAHRHKISLIDDNMGIGGGWLGPGWSTDVPAPQWIPFLDGTGFTANNGYAGPGTGSGNNVFSIGTYGGMTAGTTQSAFTSNFNGWESWFEANEPSVERFVYLCDEVSCQTTTPTLQTQLDWWTAINGVGRSLHTLATQRLLELQGVGVSVPPPTSRLSDPTSNWPYSQGIMQGNNQVDGYSALDQAAANNVQRAEPHRRLFAYNGTRPGSGSFATEDEGTSLRELAWGQYKKKIDRWFVWEGSYYDDYQNGRGNSDLFTTAQTFGAVPHEDPEYGLIGYASDNGEGVLFYPGTDVMFPDSSYGIDGPIVSLRLKLWRRGVQDVDYIALAAAKNPKAVAKIVSQMVPAALWENQCPDPANDCSYFIGPVTWSNNPDDWEKVRAQLAHIIDGQ